ncbi:hypothetical protein [Butyricimonas hominis]
MSVSPSVTWRDKGDWNLNKNKKRTEVFIDKE